MTITAPQDGTEDLDGMRLGELEAALRRVRQNGGRDDDLLDVRTNRLHRVRTVSAEVDESQPVRTTVGHPEARMHVSGAALVTCDGHELSADYAGGDEVDSVVVL